MGSRTSTSVAGPHMPTALGLPNPVFAPTYAERRRLFADLDKVVRVSDHIVGQKRLAASKCTEAVVQFWSADTKSEMPPSMSMWWLGPDGRCVEPGVGPDANVWMHVFSDPTVARQPPRVWLPRTLDHWAAVVGVYLTYAMRTGTLCTALEHEEGVWGVNAGSVVPTLDLTIAVQSRLLRGRAEKMLAHDYYVPAMFNVLTPQMVPCDVSKIPSAHAFGSAYLFMLFVTLNTLRATGLVHGDHHHNNFMIAPTRTRYVLHGKDGSARSVELHGQLTMIDFDRSALTDYEGFDAQRDWIAVVQVLGYSMFQNIRLAGGDVDTHDVISGALYAFIKCKAEGGRMDDALCALMEDLWTKLERSPGAGERSGFQHIDAWMSASAPTLVTGLVGQLDFYTDRHRAISWGSFVVDTDVRGYVTGRLGLTEDADSILAPGAMTTGASFRANGFMESELPVYSCFPPHEIRALIDSMLSRGTIDLEGIMRRSVWMWSYDNHPYDMYGAQSRLLGHHVTLFDMLTPPPHMIPPHLRRGRPSHEPLAGPYGGGGPVKLRLRF